MSASSCGAIEVLALVDVGLLAGGVVVDRARRAHEAKAVGDLAVGVLVGRVGERDVAQQLRRGAAVVAQVDAEEGHALAVVQRRALDDGQLDAARHAPRGPHVDHDRVPAQRAHARLQALARAGQQVVGLRVQRGEGRRGAVELGVQLLRRRSCSPSAGSGPWTPGPAAARRRRSPRGRSPRGSMAASGAFAEGCQTRPRVRRTRPTVRYPASYSRGGSLNPGKSLPCIVPGPAGGLRVARHCRTPRLSVQTDSQVMADSMSAAAEAAAIPDQAAIERAEAFTRERFVHDGEDPAVALAPGSARRRALEDALREIDAGAKVPVDQMAPALRAAARPRARAQRGRAAPGRRRAAEPPPGRRALGHADRAAGRRPERPRPRRVRPPSRCSRSTTSPSPRCRSPPRRTSPTTSDDELDADDEDDDDDEPEAAVDDEDDDEDDEPEPEPDERRRGRRGARGRLGGRRRARRRRGRRGGRRRRPQRPQALLVRARHRRRQDRRRDGLRRGLAHRRRPHPHPPAQPRRPVPRRAARPRLRPAASRRPLLDGAGHRPLRRPGHRRDLPVVRAQRRAHLRRLHDRHLRRGAHRAGREDVGGHPRVDRPDLHRHDGHGRAHRPPRHRPLPDADLALRPRAGRAPRRHRAAALHPHPARPGRAHDREGAAAPRRRRRRVRPGDAGRAAGPAAVQHGDRQPLQDALQRRAGRDLRRRRAPRLQRRRVDARRRASRPRPSRARRPSASWPRSSPPTSAARSTCSSTPSCWPRAGTRRARRSACTWRRPPRGASTSSASAA